MADAHLELLVLVEFVPDVLDGTQQHDGHVIIPTLKETVSYSHKCIKFPHENYISNHPYGEHLKIIFNKNYINMVFAEFIEK